MLIVCVGGFKVQFAALLLKKKIGCSVTHSLVRETTGMQKCLSTQDGFVFASQAVSISVLNKKEEADYHKVSCSCG